MPESEQNAADVIESYRRRRERTVPLLLGGLAIVLLVVGIFLIVIYFTGNGLPSTPSFLASATPTNEPATETPAPPTLTPTITLTPEPSLTPTPEWPKTHIVELGESLWTIAEQYGVTIGLIVAYNEIEDPNNVPIGTQLTIPEPESELPTETPLPEDLQPGDKIEYFVKPGDTLASIALEFNTTAEAIAEENDIEDPDNIGIGTLLIITVGATPTPTQTELPGTGTPTPTAVG
ncbi:MAG: LysM peptidoglycan-binding domain-containing protein [Anaerolineales bacterium]|nr:LysM peptidoglycan-binding domain-containing protein [Anaerolineales bacterium]